MPDLNVREESRDWVPSARPTEVASNRGTGKATPPAVPEPIRETQRPASDATPPVTQVPVHQIRFSQNTISGQTYLPRPGLPAERITLKDLVQRFKDHGYVSEPIQVVRMPDGALTSLDNRRLWAAQEAGLDEIEARVYPADAPFNGVKRQGRFLKLGQDLIDHRGELGPAGRTLHGVGSEPRTMGQAVVFRCANQLELTGWERALLGELTPPIRLGEDSMRKGDPARASEVDNTGKGREESMSNTRGSRKIGPKRGPAGPGRQAGKGGPEL